MPRLRGSTWQADLRGPDGQRHRATFATEAEADVWEAEARLAVLKGKPIPGAKTGKVGKRDLSTLGALYDHTARTHWVSKRAAVMLCRNGEFVVDFFGRNMDVASITTADLADLAAAMGEQFGNSGATINRKLAAASKMLAIAKEEGVIHAVPRIPKREEGAGRVRYLTEDEEARMMAYWQMTGDTFHEDLCVFLIRSGARVFSEAGKLTWADITPRGATFWVTKTNRPRSVPLGPSVRAALARRKAEAPNGAGPFRSLTRDSARSRWDRMQTHTGFNDVTLHTLRHTCASRLVMAGVDLLRVQKFMGHTAISTTLRYAHLAPSALDGMEDILDRPAATVLPFERREA